MTLCNLLPILIGLGAALIGYWIGKMIPGSRVAELEADIEQKDAAYNLLRGEREDLVKNRTVLQGKLDESDAARKDWEEKYHVLFGKQNDLGVQRDAALAGQHALTAKYNSAVADFDALGNRHNSVVADFEDHKTKSATTVQGFEGLVGEWTAERAEIDRRQAEAKTEIDRLNSEKADWQKKYDALSEDYHFAKGQIGNLEDALEATRQENTDRLASLQDRFASLKSVQEHDSTDAHSYTVHLDDLTREKNSDLQTFANYKADTEARLVRADSDYADLEGRYNALKETLNRNQQNLVSDNETAQGPQEELIARHNQLLDNHRQVHGQLADLQETHRLAGEQIQTLYNDHAAYANEMENARAAHRADYEALMQQFKELQGRHEALENDHNAHVINNEETQKALNQQIADWSQSYNDLQLQHQELQHTHATQLDAFQEDQRAQGEKQAKLELQYAEAGRANKELEADVGEHEAARQEADAARVEAEQKIADQATEWKQKYDQLQTAHDQRQMELDQLSQNHTTALQDMETLRQQTALEIEERQATIDEWSKRYSIVAINLSECERLRAEAAHVNRRDDLKIVEGIGPKIEALLNNAGIMTFKQLSATSTQALRAILNEAGSSFAMHDPGTWPAQSDLASNGEWEKLQQYKDYLVGGKDPK